VRDIWPDALYIPYVEWWYRWTLVDMQFLGELPDSQDTLLRQRIRNAPTLLDFAIADFAITPTQYQAAQFEPRERALLEVIHDGVDTRLAAPAAEPPARIAGLDVAAMPEIVTYATRGMEPQRGFPQFMRALEILQKRRPGLHAIVVGEDRVAYGKKLVEGDSWKKRMLAELDLDLARVHFTGPLPRPDYHAVLQVTNAHVYLTVPFVLSWSMLEAMSTACPMVVSDTDPVREFMDHGETGLMADFHDPRAIAEATERLLDDRADARRFGAAARARIVERYELEDIARRKRAMLEEALAARRAV
jgi:glycosyltransferase involved in cell wall biosynthesis